MALIKCPKCGMQFSEHAEKCPQCGTSITEALNQKEKQAKEEHVKTIRAYVACAIIILIGFCFIYALAMLQG